MSPRKRQQTAARKVPRQSRSRYMVDLILNTTTQILLQEGYDQVSTNRIAEVAGISIGSLYQYFPNKDAILSALAVQHSQKMSAILQERFATMGDAPIDRAAREIIGAEFSAHAVDARLHRTLLQRVPKPNRVTPEHDVHLTAMELVRAFLGERCRHPGPDLDLASFILVHTISALSEAALRLRPKLLSDETFQSECVALVTAYLQRLSDGWLPAAAKR